METEMINVNTIQEVAAILMHVREGLREHQKMQKDMESYLEKNALKQQYEKFLEKKLEIFQEEKLKKDEKAVGKPQGRSHKQNSVR